MYPRRGTSGGIPPTYINARSISVYGPDALTVIIVTLLRICEQKDVICKNCVANYNISRKKFNMNRCTLVYR